VVDVGGTFGRDLSAKGEAAMVDFAATWLAGLYGADIKNSVKRRHATRWNNEPWVLGAWSAAAPGAQSARKIMTEPVSSRIFFAGEATHESLWGTVNGAWDSGERAADAVLKLTGASWSLHALKVPPVRLPTSATILAATASISSSVIVFSRGCSVTAIATDFLPGSMPLPS
jgi:hypothetical protein